MIFETVIYDGGMKQFRVLNLVTGTFYCVAYDTYNEAWNTIADGTERAGDIVKAICIQDINIYLNRSAGAFKFPYVWEVLDSFGSVVNEVKGHTELDAISDYARLTDLNFSKIREIGYTFRRKQS